MSAKVIAQILVSAVQVLTRASVQAYQQALRNAKNPGAQANPLHAKKRMHLDEALAILNLEKSETTPEVLQSAYKKFFELNDPSKGGSFYLQSKIFRANEAAKVELGFEEDEDTEEEDDNDSDGESKSEEGREDGAQSKSTSEESEKEKGK